MNHSPLQFLQKVIRVRKVLIRAGRSGWDNVEMEMKMKPICDWLNFWKGKTTDAGALAIIREHHIKILDIIPGGESGCGKALRDELQSYINPQFSTHERSKTNVLQPQGSGVRSKVPGR